MTASAMRTDHDACGAVDAACGAAARVTAPLANSNNHAAQILVQSFGRRIALQAVLAQDVANFNRATSLEAALHRRQQRHRADPLPQVGLGPLAGLEAPREVLDVVLVLAGVMR